MSIPRLRPRCVRLLPDVESIRRRFDKRLRNGSVRVSYILNDIIKTCIIRLMSHKLLFQFSCPIVTIVDRTVGFSAQTLFRN